MEEQEKPRFKVDEPVYVIAFDEEKNRIKGFITYIHKERGFRPGYKTEGEGVYVYYLYSVDVTKGSGKNNNKFEERYIQERY